MRIEKDFYGYTQDGEEVYCFTLKNSSGVEVKVTNFGGRVISINVPSRDGVFEDVVLGYDKLEDYISDTNGFGATIGRFANRIENAKFELNGVEYKVSQNCGKHHIHGGFIGFDKVVWDAKIINGENGDALELSYISKDGEEGFPGELHVKVKLSLTEDNVFVIEYYGISDKDTVVNLTNHSYFNLAGHGNGDILSHELMIKSDSITCVDKDGLPTGEILLVKDTPFDFNALKPIGIGINSEDEQIILGNGYDHNYILEDNNKTLEKFAEVYERTSGRVMEVYTNKPGVQVYTGNFLNNQPGKQGAVYTRRSGLCLETQHFPNSLKHNSFPSPVIKAGQEYKYTTVFKFTIK
jgi:aldose 1-epimerase